MTKTVYAQIAQLVDARLRCLKTGNEWAVQHQESIESIVKNQLPSGSGWDVGTRIDLDASTPDRLVFYGEFHHMNENGFYDGWTDHRITVRPSLAFGITLTISGRNRNDIKEYLYDLFHTALTETLVG